MFAVTVRSACPVCFMKHAEMQNYYLLQIRIYSFIHSFIHSFESGNEAHKKTIKNIKNMHEKQTDRKQTYNRLQKPCNTENTTTLKRENTF